MPALRQVRLYGKPLVFIAACLPLLGLAAGAAGLGGLRLGPNPVETIQDTTGLWALRLLLLTLSLTPLRQATGRAWPVQFRRMLGLFAFAYAALHFANYLLLDRALDFGEITGDLVRRRFITVGFTAFLLLSTLAVTSTGGWRRRLGRRWQTLHQAIYPATLLVCWHFWWQVKKDFTEPLVYCLCLLGLLMLRAGQARRLPPG